MKRLALALSLLVCLSLTAVAQKPPKNDGISFFFRDSLGFRKLTISENLSSAQTFRAIHFTLLIKPANSKLNPINLNSVARLTSDTESFDDSTETDLGAYWGCEYTYQNDTYQMVFSMDMKTLEA